MLTLMTGRRTCLVRLQSGYLKQNAPLIWLVLLFLGEMLTATAMGHFEDEIVKAMVLAYSSPLIISSGGNSGSQASTLIIRAMVPESDGPWARCDCRDWWRVAGREILSGLLLGVILAGVGFMRIAVWSAFGNPERSLRRQGRNDCF
jgi:magnesium transporter